MLRLLKQIVRLLCAFALSGHNTVRSVVERSRIRTVAHPLSASVRRSCATGSDDVIVRSRDHRGRPDDRPSLSASCCKPHLDAAAADDDDDDGEDDEMTAKV